MPLLQPLRRFKLILLVFLNHLVSLGRDQDAFGGLGLAETVVRRNDLLDRTLRIILELYFPIIKGLCVSITMLRNIRQSLLIKHLILVLIKFHEFMQV